VPRQLGGVILERLDVVARPPKRSPSASVVTRETRPVQMRRRRRVRPTGRRSRPVPSSISGTVTITPLKWRRLKVETMCWLMCWIAVTEK
jgi:hypothetical protein